MGMATVVGAGISDAETDISLGRCRLNYSGGPEVSGHFQNHSQNQQKWAFSKIENKYFLISIVYHISQSLNISLGEASSQVSTCGSL